MAHRHVHALLWVARLQILKMFCTCVQQWIVHFSFCRCFAQSFLYVFRLSRGVCVCVLARAFFLLLFFLFCWFHCESELLFISILFFFRLLLRGFQLNLFFSFSSFASIRFWKMWVFCCHNSGKDKKHWIQYIKCILSFCWCDNCPYTAQLKVAYRPVRI